ncbi:acyl-CoA dehydrogenase family protein [Paracraurococcus lichenis]|uniref:Dibenzothiophene monooxygenase n=1 Tax=Paracraurococcus lichenis TaxID=3064888 RepID=A0ABT9E682_9PROT|nr:acyl-CoA dehydrogenase family protein [Paracraurococcus sp. LOR1-02]MDO9711495.1 acyl-CoA dehydrogenase family protein [Paracraurococcus sp. LOR1-02]
MPDIHPHPQADPLARLHALAVTEFRARAAAHEQDGTLPVENLQAVHRLGLLHGTVSRANGGLDGSLAGRDPGLYLQVLRTICHGDASTGHCYQVHNHALWILEALATPAQVERFLHPLVRRFSLAATVGSEPGRTNIYEFKTKARRVEGGWRVGGVKNFATNGPAADLIITFVAIDGIDDYFDNHLMLLLEPSMPGVTVTDDWYRPHGMRAARSSVIQLDDVFVPDLHVLGEPGAYPRGRWQGRFHLGFAANYLGTTEGLYDWFLEHARSRGRAANPLIQLRTGEMRIALDSARALFGQAIAAWRTEEVVEAELQSMSAKYAAARAAFELAQTVLRNAGATAQFDEHPLGRLVRDLETHVVHSGHDRTAQIIGQAALGQQFDSTQQR